MLVNIDEIQRQADEMILRAGFPKHSVNLCSAPYGDGTPYISFEKDSYNYIYSERGYEFFPKSHSLFEYAALLDNVRIRLSDCLPV